MLWLALLGGCSGEDTDTTDTDTDTDGGDDTGDPDDTGGTPTGDTGVGPGELTASAELHPTYGTLVRVTWDQPAAGEARVEYSFDAGTWAQSPSRDLGPGVHDQLLVGIPYATEVTWRVVVDGQATADQAITTAELPLGLPEASVVGDPGGWDPDMPYVFVSVTGGAFLGDAWWALVLDRQGRAVWARRSPEAESYLHPRLGFDERSMMLDLNTYWGSFPSDGGDNSRVERFLLDGTVLETFDTPGLHHDYTELPDGSIVWGAYEPPYVNERLMRRWPDGTVQEVFDCQAWLTAQGFGNWWCGSNTVSYDEANDRLWWSMFSFMTILEIDPATGTVENTWGNLPGSWEFSPTAADGFWYQHGGHLTPTGTLLTSSWASLRGVETVVREYEIDRVNQRLNLVWEFGEGDGVWEEPEQQMGEAYRLPNGNTLHNTGTVPRLREATPAGDVVWDVTWAPALVTAIGRSAPVRDLWVLLPEPR